ncbi:MAG: TonB family protein [Vicinamibacterales bacterium]
MASDLFGDVTHAPRRLGARRWYTLPLSILTHGVAVAAIVVIPLIATGELPAIRRAIVFGDADITPIVPPPPMRRASAPRSAQAPPSSRDAAPTEAPPTIEPEAIPLGIPDVGEVDGVPDGIVGGLPADMPSAWTPSPQPPVVSPRPIRITQGVTPPRRIVYVQPVYPTIAQANRITGRVVIEAIIGPTGEVQSARVVQSVPLLDQAALAAVRQWKYTPTLLNGVPVSVILTVSVDFKLAG